MAEGKKSFIAYSDWQGTFKALPDDIAGQLIKYIFSYVNDEEPEPHENFVVNALFEQFKATLKRDLNKWEKQREQRSKAGKKSAELRATKSNERSTSVNEKTRKATVSDSVSVNVSDTIISIKEKDEDFYFKKAQANYKTYAEQLFKDDGFIESISYNHIKHRNREVNVNTIHKYLKEFLIHLNEYKHVHTTKKDFSNNFSNWLRKQKIEVVLPPKENRRYV